MIHFKEHSGIYTLNVEQHLKIDIQQAWDFFSSPSNLAKMTPSHIGFKITSSESKSMYPGQIISYQIALLPGVKSGWVTEITHVLDKSFFVDEQRFGPYRMWHHEHHFVEKNGGVLMIDKVSYKLPAGVLGRLLHPIIIKPQLKKIFSHRIEVLEKMFNQEK